MCVLRYGTGHTRTQYMRPSVEEVNGTWLMTKTKRLGLYQHHVVTYIPYVLKYTMP